MGINVDNLISRRCVRAPKNHKNNSNSNNSNNSSNSNNSNNSENESKESQKTSLEILDSMDDDEIPFVKFSFLVLYIIEMSYFCLNTFKYSNKMIGILCIYVAFCISKPQIILDLYTVIRSSHSIWCYGNTDSAAGIDGKPCCSVRLQYAGIIFRANSDTF